MNAIKSVYNFVLTFQILELFIFLYFFIENGLYIDIPISVEIWEFEVQTTIEFNIGSLIAVVVAITLILVLSGIQAVGSGLNDTATTNMKELIILIALSTILGFPTLYLFSLSEYLIEYGVIFNFICFLVYVVNYFNGKNSGVD